MDAVELQDELLPAVDVVMAGEVDKWAVEAFTPRWIKVVLGVIKLDLFRGVRLRRLEKGGE
jgi:hypothetical protein